MCQFMVVWWDSLWRVLAGAGFLRPHFQFVREFIKRKWIFLRSGSINFFGDGFIYIRGLVIIICADALIVDDEPLWEPLEWSLIQIWLVFIFLFAWIGENLISSRFGSYTGRDKRVWFAWYKSFWLIGGWYQISFGAAAMFVIVPFYYEVTYHLSFIVSWWDWYNRVFFCRFLGFLSLIVLLAQLTLIANRVWSWIKVLMLVGIVNLLLLYILYAQFMVAFFAYFTDPIWYQKTRFIEAVQLSHEPAKWGWGSVKRDHFTYHRTTSGMWFKNDGPFAGAMLLFQLALLLIVFFVNIYWLSLFRRIYGTGEVSFTFLTYCVSTLRQFTIGILGFYGLVGFSFLSNYWRYPIEFLFTINSPSWWHHFADILINYGSILYTLF